MAAFDGHLSVSRALTCGSSAGACVGRLFMRCGVAVFLAVPYNEVDKADGLTVVAARPRATGEQEEEGTEHMDDIREYAKRIESIADGLVEELLGVQGGEDRFPGLYEKLREISDLADSIKDAADAEEFRALS